MPSRDGIALHAETGLNSRAVARDRRLHPRTAMSLGSSLDLDVRYDGFGVRHIEQDAAAVRVEVVDVSATLSTTAAEQSIRARASRLMDAAIPGLVPIRHISRVDRSLCIVSELPHAVPLGDLLAGLEFGTITLSEEALLELAGATVRAVAALHEAQPGLAHGALSPSHVLIRPDGTALLTGAVFGDALQALKCNREQLWRTFGIAMPPSASLPRFDQRSDLTQLGALVLSMMLRRTMTAGEYPRQVADLVFAATANVAAAGPWGASFRLWIQQALQLHPKALFSTGADAARMFAAIEAKVPGRRAGADELHAVLRQLCGQAVDHVADAVDDDFSTFVLDEIEPAQPALAAHGQPMPPPRALSFLRNVFPQLRAN